MPRQKLNIIDEPQPLTRSVIKLQGNFDGPFFVGAEGGTQDYICGNCSQLLAARIWSGSIIYVVVECPKCHHFNDFAYTKPTNLPIQQIQLTTGTFFFASSSPVRLGHQIEGMSKSLMPSGMALSKIQVAKYLIDNGITQPLTRDVVLALIRKNNNSALDLDLSELDLRGIDLSNLDLSGVILKNSNLNAYTDGIKIIPSNLNNSLVSHADMQGVHLNAATIISANFTSANLRNSHITGADVRSANFFEADLTNADLSGANLEATNFTLCQMKNICLTQSRIVQSTMLANAVWGPQYKLGNKNKSIPRDTSEYAYRQLKIWHQNAGLYDLVGEFHFREWASRREIQLSILSVELKTKRIGAIFGCLSQIIPLYIAESLCGYGERWRRIVFWDAVIITLFAVSYFIWSPILNKSFVNALLYSGGSFTTLGFNLQNTIPSWARFAGLTEAFAGIFLNSLFLITFIRKWTR